MLHVLGYESIADIQLMWKTTGEMFSLDFASQAGVSVRTVGLCVTGLGSFRCCDLNTGTRPSMCRVPSKRSRSIYFVLESAETYLLKVCSTFKSFEAVKSKTKNMNQ